MVSFTRISESEVPSITIDTTQRLSDIDPRIYSGFTEHMGRCIYGGLYDPGNSLSDENGFRRDVLEALRELRMPVVRYPGGNFCATYHWKDGVGPKEERPSRPELAWLGTETNQFGTDEFMKWCKTLDTEPYLCLNFGTGTLDEALAWVEYCNGAGDTYYANMRRRNGHDEPYNVKYWALGNEMWGPWQINQMTADQYAHRALQWAKALKLLSPSISLILCGSDGLQNSTWDSHILTTCLQPPSNPLSANASSPLFAMHSIHLYTSSSTHPANAFAPLAAERAIETTSALIDAALIANNVPLKTPEWRPKICFDEWNVWDPQRAVGEKGAEEKYTLSDALAVAVWLNVFVRQCGRLGMACIAQSVNVISPLMTHDHGIVKQTTWYPLWLFSKFMRGTTVTVGVRCAAFDGDTQPSWIGQMREVPWMDVSACVDGAWANLMVVNVCAERGWETELRGLVVGEGEVVVWRVEGRRDGQGEREGMGVTNLDGEEEVKASEERWDGKGRFIFRKASATLLRWSI